MQEAEQPNIFIVIIVINTSYPLLLFYYWWFYQLENQTEKYSVNYPRSAS